MNIGSLQALHAISLNIFVIGISQILFFLKLVHLQLHFQNEIKIYHEDRFLISDSEKCFLKKFFIARLYIKGM